MTRIKICGITSDDAAQTAVAAGADALGFVFAERSPRCIDVERAVAIARDVPPFVSIVAVFDAIEQVERVVAAGWPHRWLQIHGDATPATLGAALARIAPGRPVLRGFEFDPDALRTWDRCDAVSALLVDGSSGGHGRAFRHDELTALMPGLTKPVVLAGGLAPDNVGDAIRATRPYAVDVSSGVESAPGVKDSGLVREFCAAVRRA